MITLFTGLPGHGKTLYALVYVKGFAEKHQRPVFYSGIRDLAIPGWTLFGDSGENPDKPWETDASKWYELPDGAIILIDEAQRLFRPRGTGSAVPPYVAQLETHRHRGFDIFIITQHPMLIDSNVRRLVGQHFHSVRLLGMNRATVHEFPSCTEIAKARLDESVRHEFSYPKEAFGWYKSAEIHTHQKRIPMRVWLMLCAPLLIGGLLWYGYDRVSKFWTKKSEDPAKAVSAGKGSAVSKGLGVSDARASAPASYAPGTPIDHSESVQNYAASYRPRLEGLPHTAAVYDGVTTPTRAPVPVACVRNERRCFCFSQDGTKIAMETTLCESIVANGYFIPFSMSGPASAQSMPAGANPVAAPSGAKPMPAAAAPAAPPGPAGKPGVSINPTALAKQR